LPRSRSTSREPVVAAVMNMLSATLSTLIPVGLSSRDSDFRGCSSRERLGLDEAIHSSVG
jgi:hypothetical protein